MTSRLGILVAGGAGRRMGDGAPKAERLVGGVTLLARAEANLRACCDDWIVCAPEGLPLPVENGRRVPDAVPAAGPREGPHGPLAGLVAGLAAREFGAALVLGVDFPLLDPPALLALRDALGGHRGAAVALAAPGGVPQPLAAWYAPAAVAPLAHAFASGERSLTRAVLALPHAIVPVDEARFLNVNTPDDLVRAERFLERLPS